MANASNWLIEQALNHAINDTPWTAPTALYVALLKSTAAASDTPATQAAKEVETPASNGYDRELVTFDAESGQAVLSNNQLTFGPSVTAWDEATDYWIVDALTGGNILWYGQLVAAKTVGALGSGVIEIGDISVAMA